MGVHTEKSEDLLTNVPYVLMNQHYDIGDILT